jgi:hypothetical protein
MHDKIAGTTVVRWRKPPRPAPVSAPPEDTQAKDDRPAQA